MFVSERRKRISGESYFCRPHFTPCASDVCLSQSAPDAEGFYPPDVQLWTWKGATDADHLIVLGNKFHSPVFCRISGSRADRDKVCFTASTTRDISVSGSGLRFCRAVQDRPAGFSAPARHLSTHAYGKRGRAAVWIVKREAKSGS